MSKSTAISDISSPSFLTPTTLKNITQILESQECMKGIQAYEETGDVNKAVTALEVKEKHQPVKSDVLPNTRTRSRNTYFNLDSKSWQGGITTVATPTDRISSVVEDFAAENQNTEEDLERNSDEENSSEILNGSFLPESVVQTNNRQQKKQPPVQRTMITRSLSNMSNSSGKTSTRGYHSYEKKNMMVAKKTSARGKRTTRYNPEEEALTHEERERLQVRRQRNKEAAARCRKRRVDQTNTLQSQVDQWMEKKRAMEDEIGALTREKEELEFILSQHCQADNINCAIGGKRRRTTMVAQPVQQIIVRRVPPASSRNLIQQQQMRIFNRPIPQKSIPQTTQTRIVAIKSEPTQPTVIVEPVNQPYILPEQIQIPTVKVEANPVPVSVMNMIKPNNNVIQQQPLRRPATLGLNKLTVIPQQQQQQNNDRLSGHGIAIDTPSSIVPSLNFDTFTSTGLTPTATPVTGFSFPVTSASTPGTLNTPMTNTASSSISSRCVTQQRLSEVGIGSVTDINSPEGISLVSL